MTATYHGKLIPDKAGIAGCLGTDIDPSKEWLAIIKGCGCSECKAWLSFWNDHGMMAEEHLN